MRIEARYDMNEGLYDFFTIFKIVLLEVCKIKV